MSHFVWTKLRYANDRWLKTLATYDFRGPNQKRIWEGLPIDQSHDDVIINGTILNGHPLFSVFIISNNQIFHNHVRINTRSNKYLVSDTVGRCDLKDEFVFSSMIDEDCLTVLSSDTRSLRIRQFQPTPYSFEDVSTLAVIKDEVAHFDAELDESLDLVIWKNSSSTLQVDALSDSEKTVSFSWPLSDVAQKYLKELGERQREPVEEYSALASSVPTFDLGPLPGFDPTKTFKTNRRHFNLNIARKDLIWDNGPKLQKITEKDYTNSRVTAVDRYSQFGRNDPRYDGLIRLQRAINDQLPERRGNNILHRLDIPEDYEPILYTNEEAKRDAEKVFNSILDEEILSRGRDLSASRRIKIRKRLKRTSAGKSLFDDIVDSAHRAMQVRREAERPWMERAEQFDRYSGRAGQQLADDIIRIIVAIREAVRENEAIKAAFEEIGDDPRKGVEGVGAPIDVGVDDGPEILPA